MQMSSFLICADEMGGVQAQPGADQADQSDKDKLDDLEQMLSPNLDMDREIADVDLMLTRGLEQIDSKTVEDIFKGVLSTDQANTSSSPAASEYSSQFGCKNLSRTLLWHSLLSVSTGSCLKFKQRSRGQ